MSEKIINIKNVLKIMLSILIIFSMIKSCAKAWDDYAIIKYTNDIINDTIVTNSAVKACANKFVSNMTYVGSKIDISQYSSFFFGQIYNSNGIWFLFCKDTPTISNASNFRITTNEYASFYFPGSGSPSFSTSTNYANAYTNRNYNTYGLTIGTIPAMMAEAGFLQNKWVAGTLTVEMPYTLTNPEQYTIFANFYVGASFGANTPTFNLTNGVKTSRNLLTDATNNPNGGLNIAVEVIIDDLTDLLEQDLYLTNSTGHGTLQGIKFYANTSNGYVSQPVGFIGQISGDNFSGEIDLSETNSLIDGISQNINAIPDKIGNLLYHSGDSGENGGIIQKIFKDLFTIKPNYAQEKFEELREENIISGDYEDEKAFLNVIAQTSDDFVISWNDFTPHFSIGGSQMQNTKMINAGNINFTEMERNNNTLHEVMMWVRAILGFSLGAILIKNYWKTFMHTLGVGVSVYEENADEKEIAKNATNNKQKGVNK